MKRIKTPLGLLLLALGTSCVSSAFAADVNPFKPAAAKPTTAPDPTPPLKSLPSMPAINGGAPNNPGSPMGVTPPALPPIPELPGNMFPHPVSTGEAKAQAVKKVGKVNGDYFYRLDDGNYSLEKTPVAVAGAGSDSKSPTQGAAPRPVGMSMPGTSVPGPMPGTNTSMQSAATSAPPPAIAPIVGPMQPIPATAAAASSVPATGATAHPRSSNTPTSR